VCIVALPAGETRTLKHLPVFLVTASFSLFAYIWMVIVLVVWTPNLITITEGLLTLSFMLILVAIAFAADQGYLSATGSAYASRSLKLLSIKREPTTRAHDAPDAPDGTPGVGVPVGSVPVITEAEVAKYLKTLELGLNTSSSTLGGGDIDIEMSGGKSPAASPSKESPGTRAQIEPTATSGTSTNPQASNLSPEEIAKGLMVEQDAARPTSRTEHRAKALKALTGGMSFKPSLRKLRSGSKESAADIIADSGAPSDRVGRAARAVSVRLLAPASRSHQRPPLRRQLTRERALCTDVRAVLLVALCRHHADGRGAHHVRGLCRRDAHRH
jgi:hypothetical protein